MNVIEEKQLVRRKTRLQKDLETRTYLDRRLIGFLVNLHTENGLVNVPKDHI
jgi:hypothetical protein